MSTATLSPDVRTPSAWGQALAIAWRTLAQRSRGLLAWTLGLVLGAVMQIAVYPSMASSGDAMQQYVDAWPDALREAFGLADYTTAAGFLNTELFSFVVPLVLVGVALAAGAAATAGEEEQGTLELLLSVPVRRSTVLAGKALAMVVAVAVASAALVLTLLIGDPIVDLNVGAGYLVAATAACAFIALAFGSVGLLLGALTGHRAVALGTGFGLVLATYLIDILAPMADWLKPWQNVSPFHWVLDNSPLKSGLALSGAALVLAVALAAAAAAFAVFARRDISTR